MAVTSNGELTVEKGAKGYQVRRRRAGRLRVCLRCCHHTLIVRCAVLGRSTR